jgi:hypothetical protein
MVLSAKADWKCNQRLVAGGAHTGVSPRLRSLPMSGSMFVCAATLPNGRISCVLLYFVGLWLWAKEAYVGERFHPPVKGFRRHRADGEFECNEDFSSINALIPLTLVAFRGRNQGYDGKDVTP